MNRRTREGFYTLWTAAILIGLVLCVFALLFTSCVKGTDSAQTTEDTTVQTDGSGELTEETPAADAAAEETPATDAAAEEALTTEEPPAAEEALTE